MSKRFATVFALVIASMPTMSLGQSPGVSSSAAARSWVSGNSFGLRSARLSRSQTNPERVGEVFSPGDSISNTAPCANALTQQAVCEAANRRALEIMNTRNLEAIIVVQDVQTGALVAFAASNPKDLDVTSQVLPLSTVKLMLAASWWDHGLPEEPTLADAPKMSVTEMVVKGTDLTGRRMAASLRKSVGTPAVLKDLEKYGFPSRTSEDTTRDLKFWSELDEQLRNRLQPHRSFNLLSARTTTNDWEDTLSIGEARFTVTALHVSRFLQAVGNSGVMIPPAARVEKGTNSNAHRGQTSLERERGPIRPTSHIRIMRDQAASKLQEAMRGVVQRGTATSIAKVLDGTGWQIGGKTGTGPGPQPIGPNSDGWFAGLVFDPQNKARYSFATFVRHGGLGGGNAARLSAELARFIIDGSKGQ
jgi:cell division protein FtsI/penicillin-binding protein 2